MEVDDSAGFKRRGGAIILKSTADTIDGFGTLMQTFRASRYLGKKLRLSGWLKAKDVNGWAGYWLRVDNDKTSIAFDNMHERPVKGTRNWTYCEIVLPVSTGALNIAFGILLDGTGQVWADGLRFDVVSNNTPATGDSNHEGPVNLNFRK